MDASAVAEVFFSPDAARALAAAVPHLRFYTSADEVREAIIQMLQLDIRSVHQGRGKQTASGEGQQYCCRFDALDIAFSHFKTHILVRNMFMRPKQSTSPKLQRPDLPSEGAESFARRSKSSNEANTVAASQ